MLVVLGWRGAAGRRVVDVIIWGWALVEGRPCAICRCSWRVGRVVVQVVLIRHHVWHLVCCPHGLVGWRRAEAALRKSAFGREGARELRLQVLSVLAVLDVP